MGNIRHELVCQYCGIDYIAKKINSKYCSDKCRSEADKLHKRQKAIERGAHDKKKCSTCNKIFISKTSKDKFCSNKCRWKKYNQSDIEKQHRRNYVKAHRRRYEGILIDSDISLFKLSNRDNNQCKICGLFVDWSDSPQGNMYPSIDHITPISLGGLHEWSNVQLAHRICNTRKSNKYIG